MFDKGARREDIRREVYELNTVFIEAMMHRFKPLTCKLQ